MVSDSEWISWAEASHLTGIRVPTIEHATRVGRIRRRPRHGTRPSLDRESVLQWAAWYVTRRSEIEQRRAARPPRPRAPAVRRVVVREAPPEGWVDTATAAAVLGVTPDTVRRLARAGELEHRVIGGRFHLNPVSVSTLAGHRSQWVSFADAALLLGCTPGVVERLAREGWFERRTVYRALASLSRESVEAAVPRWHALLAEAERARVARTRRRTAERPPDDGQVWLDVATTALALGVTRSAVRQRIVRGTLPAVQEGRRWWLRRRDVEIVAASRAFGSLRDLNAP